MNGWTNRQYIIGRLEVQVEIPLPNREGRREILQIHFEALRRNGRLSQSLCRAIDGSSNKSNTNDGGRKPKRIFFSPSRIATLFKSLPSSSSSSSHSRISDLAASIHTGGFSGADIAGLVRCAGSIALSRSRKQGDGLDGLLITLEDVAEALKEVKQ